MTPGSEYRYQNLWIPSGFRADFVVQNDNLVSPNPPMDTD